MRRMTVPALALTIGALIAVSSTSVASAADPVSTYGLEVVNESASAVQVRFIYSGGELNGQTSSKDLGDDAKKLPSSDAVLLQPGQKSNDYGYQVPADAYDVGFWVEVARNDDPSDITVGKVYRWDPENGIPNITDQNGSSFRLNTELLSRTGGFVAERLRINVTEDGGDRALEGEAITTDVQIAAASNPAMVLDVYQGTLHDGARVQMFPSSDNRNQRWRFEPQGNEGWGHLINMETAKCLQSNGTNDAIDQWTCEPTHANHLWKIIADESNPAFVAFQSQHSRKYLAVAADEAQEGSPLNLENDRSTRTRFQLPTMLPAATDNAMLATALDTNLVLDIPNGSATNGTRAQLHPPHGGANQRWRFATTDPANEYGQLVNEQAGTCLNISEYFTSTADQWKCDPQSARQLWRLTPSETVSGAFALQAKTTGEYLAVKPDQIRQGAHLTLAPEESRFTPFLLPRRPGISAGNIDIADDTWSRTGENLNTARISGLLPQTDYWIGCPAEASQWRFHGRTPTAAETGGVDRSGFWATTDRNGDITITRPDNAASNTIHCATSTLPLPVEGLRITGSATERPIYRFDITPHARLQRNPASEQFRMPPFTVEGHDDATGNWRELGIVTPENTFEATDAGVTGGSASFFFQNKTGEQISQIRVRGGLHSNSIPITLSELPAPTLTKKDIDLFSVSRADGSKETTPLHANGIDTANYLVSIYNHDGELVTHGPLADAYRYVYFVDEWGQLVTGLNTQTGTLALNTNSTDERTKRISTTDQHLGSTYVNARLKLDTTWTGGSDYKLGIGTASYQLAGSLGGGMIAQRTFTQAPEPIEPANKDNAAEYRLGTTVPNADSTTVALFGYRGMAATSDLPYMNFQTQMPTHIPLSVQAAGIKYDSSADRTTTGELQSLIVRVVTQTGALIGPTHVPVN